MDNTILKKLLTEYDSKRMYKLSSLDDRKRKLMETSAEYTRLEKDLQSISIGSLKSMLSSSPSEKEEKLRILQEKTDRVLKEKEALLKKLNLPDDYLSPNFDCKICEDTGYVNNELCFCIKQKIYDLEYNRANIGNIQSENFSNFDFNVYSDEVNLQKYNSNFSPRDNMRKIVDISRNFIENFDSIDEKNLVFLGSTGLGKTFLSNCIAKEIIDSGKTVLYQTAPVMLDTIINSKLQKDNSELANLVLDVDLLIIDDLGTEVMNSMHFNELFNIINTRLLNQSSKITKTIISTNLGIKDIFNHYEERIGSRIAGYYDIYCFFGNDLRLRTKKET